MKNENGIGITLYAIDGPAMSGAGYSVGEFGVHDPAKDYESEQLFRGYPILGQVDLSGADTAEQFLVMLEDRIGSEQGLIAGCFIPRHGLRVVRDGRVTDYVICFQCTNFEWYVGGAEDRVGQQSISAKYGPVFSQPLIDAGIELALSVDEE